MTTSYTHNNPTKVELGMAAAMWLGMTDRIQWYEEGSSKWQECSLAATNYACDALEKFGGEAWGHAVNKMLEQFPSHDWTSGHGQQVVWFAKN